MQKGFYPSCKWLKLGALNKLDKLGILFISVLTNPTTGGVAASLHP